MELHHAQQEVLKKTGGYARSLEALGLNAGTNCSSSLSSSAAAAAAAATPHDLQMEATQVRGMAWGIIVGG